MTKIKIIGDPGKLDAKKIKKWVENALKKFDSLDQEIWLLFINPEKPKQILKIYQKYLIDFPKNAGDLKRHLKGVVLCYIPELYRKKGIPPLIEISNKRKVTEKDILHEITHFVEEKHGWLKIRLEVYKLLFQDTKMLLIEKEGFNIFFSCRVLIDDFFGAELMAQYGLIDEVFTERQGYAKGLIEDLFPKAKNNKSIAFLCAWAAAFITALPPSYSRKEDEEKLEETIIDYVREIEMEPLYRKMKSIFSSLEIPPNVANIYECGAKIIELAQEFLK